MVSPSPARRPGPSDRSPVNACARKTANASSALTPTWAMTIPVAWCTVAREAQDPDPSRRPTHRHTTARRPPSRDRAVPPRPPQPAPGTAPSRGSSTPITWSAGVIGRHTPWPARGLPARRGTTPVTHQSTPLAGGRTTTATAGSSTRSTPDERVSPRHSGSAQRPPRPAVVKWRLRGRARSALGGQRTMVGARRLRGVHGGTGYAEGGGGPPVTGVRVDTIGPRREWVRSFAIDRRSGSRPTPDRRRSPVFGVLWPPFGALVTAPRRGAARAGARRPRRGTCRSSGHRSGRGRCR